MGRPCLKDIRRFLIKVRMVDGGCWFWLGYKDQKGYGQFKIGGRAGRAHWAHRVSVAIFTGSVPPWVMHHKCQNPSCVNPDHMEGMTNRRNVIEGNRRRGGRSVPVLGDGDVPF